MLITRSIKCENKLAQHDNRHDENYKRTADSATELEDFKRNLTNVQNEVHTSIKLSKEVRLDVIHKKIELNELRITVEGINELNEVPNAGEIDPSRSTDVRNVISSENKCESVVVSTAISEDSRLHARHADSDVIVDNDQSDSPTTQVAVTEDRRSHARSAGSNVIIDVSDTASQMSQVMTSEESRSLERNVITNVSKDSHARHNNMNTKHRQAIAHDMRGQMVSGAANRGPRRNEFGNTKQRNDPRSQISGNRRQNNHAIRNNNGYRPPGRQPSRYGTNSYAGSLKKFGAPLPSR